MSINQVNGNGNGSAVHTASPKLSATTLNLTPTQQLQQQIAQEETVLAIAGDDSAGRVDQEAIVSPVEEDEETILLRRSEEGRRDREEANRREARRVLFLCFDLTHLSQPILFSLLSGGVLGFFLLNSWLEEYLFKQLKSFKFGWYMTAFELMCFAVFAVLERWFRRLTPADSVWQHTAQFKHHLFVAFCMTCSRGLTNKSLEYLNYPTQVIFKSMKLITVMIGSLIILNQKFTIWEYVSAVALVMSAILFSLGDVSTAPEVAGYTGIVIVCLSLVADALHSNTQEQLLKQHKSSILEAMLYTNLFAALMSWCWVVVTGEFFPALQYCSEQPVAYLLFILRAGVIYLGVLCFVLMINTFGVVKATAITTVRKILTIIASFLIFPKPISDRHVYGFLIFSIGIGVSVWDQYERARLQALRLPPTTSTTAQSIPLLPVNGTTNTRTQRANSQV